VSRQSQLITRKIGSVEQFFDESMAVKTDSSEAYEFQAAQLIMVTDVHCGQ